MANVNYNIPFSPQEGLTQQILTAISLANEHHVQNQQLSMQQQALPGQMAKTQAETGQLGAETQKTQQEVSADLPSIQAAGEKARTAQVQLQTQIQQENNPLTKAQLQAQSRNLNSEASLNEAKAAVMQHPMDVEGAVDTTIDPKKYPELNGRTKAQLNAVKPWLGIDPDLATKILGQGASEIDTIEKETDPSVIAARVQQSVQTQRQLYGGGAVSDVAPHLVLPATEAATKAGTEFAQASQMNDDFQSLLDMSKKGNKVAYAYDPVAGVLQFNVAGQTKRVNFNEISAYGGAGSAMDRIKGWFGKQATGASIDQSVLGDMEQVQKAVAKGSKDKYKRDIDVVNKNYGSKFEPLDFGGSQNTSGERPPLSSFEK